MRKISVENLSLSALIYLARHPACRRSSWESFIISLDILMDFFNNIFIMLRIFHYQPWYTYVETFTGIRAVENLSLSALIYLLCESRRNLAGWESFIISLDILTRCVACILWRLRIFHYQPWYTYPHSPGHLSSVENLSLSALIYLMKINTLMRRGWESFIISLDILNARLGESNRRLRIFHYQPWYT